jgi:hypothetical protein
LIVELYEGNSNPASGRVKLPWPILRGKAAEFEILAPWFSVWCISINEEVTKELILRINSWAYSRIPVVGDVEADSQESADCCGLD